MGGGVFIGGTTVTVYTSQIDMHALYACAG